MATSTLSESPARDGEVRQHRPEDGELHRKTCRYTLRVIEGGDDDARG